MKKLLYLILLAASFISVYYFNMGRVVASLLVNIIGVQTLSKTTLLAINLPFLLANLLVLYRILFWIKSKSFKIPETFSGGTYVVGITSVILVIISIAPYVLYAIKGTVGISGVPLVYAGALASSLAVITVVISEWRSFYNIIPNE